MNEENAVKQQFCLIYARNLRKNGFIICLRSPGSDSISQVQTGKDLVRVAIFLCELRTRVARRSIGPSHVECC